MKSNLIIYILIPILKELGLINIAIFVSSNFIKKRYFPYIKIVEVSFYVNFQEFSHVQVNFCAKGGLFVSLFSEIVIETQSYLLDFHTNDMWACGKMEKMGMGSCRPLPTRPVPAACHNLSHGQD